MLRGLRWRLGGRGLDRTVAKQEEPLSDFFRVWVVARHQFVDDGLISGHVHAELGQSLDAVAKGSEHFDQPGELDWGHGQAPFWKPECTSFGDRGRQAYPRAAFLAFRCSSL